MNLEVTDNGFLSGTTGCCNAKPSENGHVRACILKDMGDQRRKIMTSAGDMVVHDIIYALKRN